jgi:hypothetical protein
MRRNKNQVFIVTSQCMHKKNQLTESRIFVETDAYDLAALFTTRTTEEGPGRANLAGFSGTNSNSKSIPRELAQIPEAEGGCNGDKFVEVLQTNSPREDTGHSASVIKEESGSENVDLILSLLSALPDGVQRRVSSFIDTGAITRGYAKHVAACTFLVGVNLKRQKLKLSRKEAIVFYTENDSGETSAAVLQLSAIEGLVGGRVDEERKSSDFELVCKQEADRVRERVDLVASSSAQVVMRALQRTEWFRKAGMWD